MSPVTHEELLEECFGAAELPPGDVVLQVRSGEDILAHPAHAGQCGALLALAGERCLDYVSQAEAFACLWPKLRAGYLLDALERRDGAPTRAAEIEAFASAPLLARGRAPRDRPPRREGSRREASATPPASEGAPARSRLSGGPPPASRERPQR
jgi:hypothetical protein